MRIVSHDQVLELLEPDAAEGLMRTALVAASRGEVELPLRSVMPLAGGRGVLAWMPAHAAGLGALGAKAISVFPGNAARGLDAHQGAVLLFDPQDGRLLAAVDASAITAVRTAAASALATRLLARPEAATLALLGSGVQARAHLDALLRVRTFTRVRVWSRTPAHAEAFARWALERTGLEVATCAGAEEAVRGSDVVCTVTSARTPVLEGAWLEPGCHVNAVGASRPDARELDGAAVARARIFTDRRASLENESADYRAALAEGLLEDVPAVAELGEVAAGTAQGRRSTEEITLFESFGLAIEDVVAASYVLERAQRQGAGTVVELA